MREGTYLLSYRVTSADSHPVGGSIAFSIGRASWRVHTGDTVSGLGPWRIAVRALRDASLLIAAGSALFLLARITVSWRAAGARRRGMRGRRLLSRGHRPAGRGADRAWRDSGAGVMAHCATHDLWLERDCRRGCVAHDRARGEPGPWRAPDGSPCDRGARGRREPAADGSCRCSKSRAACPLRGRRPRARCSVLGRLARCVVRAGDARDRRGGAGPAPLFADRDGGGRGARSPRARRLRSCSWARRPISSTRATATS